jgi:L,D-peptidoglycan transpeptidase YkuD (ErfK/YbiS/YcfS/YnhG family)
MDVIVRPNGPLAFGGRDYPCILGRSGILKDKREGDGATPAGRFPLRRLFYRPDRLARPATRLPISPLQPEDGWCDDPEDSAYNRLIRLPYAARHETLWREDGLYDLLIVPGHNDDPPVPGLGSAIFIHVARPDGGPTEGCVSLALADLLDLASRLGPKDVLAVEAD